MAIIPARAGSKRLPGKNTVPLGDKPLILHTIEAVISSGAFDRIIVSTDDPKVINIVKNAGGIEVHHRSPDLSTDSATAVEVLGHILKEKRIIDGICGIFQPTSPFRNGGHIRQAMAQLTKEVDSVVGVTYYYVPPSFSAELLMDNSPPLLKFHEDSPLLRGSTQKQLQPSTVHPNGAIYLAWVDRFLVNNSFFKGCVSGFLMDRISSIDIDEELDLKIAGAILKHIK